MKNATCEKWRNRILPHLNGELGMVPSLALRGHLLTCPECRQEWDELHVLTGDLRNLPVPALTRPAPWASDGVTEAPPQQERRRRASLRPLLTVGATSLLLVGAGAFTAFRLGLFNTAVSSPAVTVKNPARWQVQANFSGSVRLMSPNRDLLGIVPVKGKLTTRNVTEPVAEVEIDGVKRSVSGADFLHEVRDDRDRLIGFVTLIVSEGQTFYYDDATVTMDQINQMRHSINEQQRKLKRQQVQLDGEMEKVTALMRERYERADPILGRVSRMGSERSGGSSTEGSRMGVEAEMDDGKIRWKFQGVARIQLVRPDLNLTLYNADLTENSIRGGSTLLRTTPDARKPLVSGEQSSGTRQPHLEWRVGNDVYEYNGYGTFQCPVLPSTVAAKDQRFITFHVDPL